jgi:hypothetical protein
MSNSKCGGTKFAYEMKFQEQQKLQQSLKGGRPIRIPTQVCGGDMLAHAYSTIRVSPTLESRVNEEVEKQTWCSKSDASREDFHGVYGERIVSGGCCSR